MKATLLLSFSLHTGNAPEMSRWVFAGGNKTDFAKQSVQGGEGIFVSSVK